ncbi:hypothetical protein [Pseudobacter ginsenosidimutans]|uniref:Uncharacterized protein n=1 Tax=Pseudobacter ginsenosidimutans TaxID=661488 RepID=A0A4Q7MM62_9BACT|nr:hypothetical protein [Pseudobacter ginsenosidimutans]QEC40290.1 hypothetical protein FSB84_00765 [Pseudobacter ginsenosidimutans]RZS69107.1 hypothetical protein EV199_4932 [Pseudobacter ginsenosidimutans]
MNFSFIHPFKLNLRVSTVTTDIPDIHKHQPPHSSTEGSEFLDQGLRMEDYIPVYTEINVSPGNPENLF